MNLKIESKGYFTTINEFQIIKSIGVGSSGKVYLVLHLETNKLYAIKTVNQKLFRSK